MTNDAQAKVDRNLEQMFNITEKPDPVEQGKAWSELSEHQTDNLDDLLLNKFTVELIINSNTDEAS